MIGSAHGTLEQPRLRIGAALLLIAVLVLSLALVKGPVGTASAEPPKGSINFCTPVWLQPLGRSGDRCSAGHANWGHISTVNIQTSERAGCVNYEGWYGELYASWVCTGSYSSATIYVPKDGGSYMGVIRNNNLSSAGSFRGGFYCCWTY